MPTQYPLTPGSLASSCWPAVPQTLYNEMFEKGYVTLDITGVIMSQAAPGATDRDKLWIKLDGSNYPGGHYKYQGGLWVWPHEIPSSDNSRRIWVGDIASLATYDGGTNVAVSAASGPFWEQDTLFDGRALIGAGTIPDTARTLAALGTADNLGGTGTWEHTITRAELPNERLKLFANVEEGEPVEIPDANSIIARRLDVDSEKQSYLMAEAEGYTDPTIGNTDALGQATPFVQAPPFIGIYVIKRTARIYRVG